MKQEFTSFENNNSLIIIFAGWGMSADPFRQLRIEGCDIMTVWDYSVVNFDTTPLARYDDLYIFAWSFGVFMAQSVIKQYKIKPTLKIAVNGSLHPIDDLLGIPEDIFQGTLDRLDSRNLEKFYRRMCDSRETYENFRSHMPQRDIEDLRNELLSISTLYRSYASAYGHSTWDRVIIAENDRIFPPDNLRQEWDGHNRIRTIASGHMPDWQVLIEQEIIDKRLVGEKFSKSASRYDDNASVQREIAHHLHTLWLAHTTESPSSILEIGYGTGFLTALYATSWPLADLSLWDLAPQPVKGIPANTNITACDGEKLIADVPDDTFDVITSASCIQWFQSLPKFLYHAARVVKSRGLIVLSTFGPQNIAEVSEVTHLPLRYYSADELRAMIPENCDVIALEESEMKLNFPSPRHVMSHLRNTGVNALRHTAMTVTDFTRGYPVTSSGAPLTYRPIYIIIKKRSNE
ncbi:pimeloyl-ACP methyl esterase BioG family protein [Heminiphilus faecis]|uniref:Pimeloyl-ACP methyl esterase BioG family protein n=1 Tax=Heminiphilus faecis TaxID=2601703 RepID=A0ABV4CWV0_9BACT